MRNDRYKGYVIGRLYAWSTIAILTPLARTFHQLFSFMAIGGLGETFYYPASMSMISDYHGKATRAACLAGQSGSCQPGILKASPSLRADGLLSPHGSISTRILRCWNPALSAPFGC